MEACGNTKCAKEWGQVQHVMQSVAKWRLHTHWDCFCCAYLLILQENRPALLPRNPCWTLWRVCQHKLLPARAPDTLKAPWKTNQLGPGKPDASPACLPPLYFTRLCIHSRTIDAISHYVLMCRCSDPVFEPNVMVTNGMDSSATKWSSVQAHMPVLCYQLSLSGLGTLRPSVPKHIDCVLKLVNQTYRQCTKHRHARKHH
jgi:hypothetical protein